MTRRLTRQAARRRVAIVPLALVSAAMTTHLAGATPTTTARPVPAQNGTSDRPIDPITVAPTPIEVPASVSPSGGDLTAGDNGYTPVVARTAPGEIPSSALAAYQRAEAVINAADPACRLSWQLIAAVGQVESDHGRFAGSAVDALGVVAPSIIGPVLDGNNGTALIRDTDAGQYDGDGRFDRAVGPMQFIPSTWAVVGVDADNDGVRNPQDIDDAALGAAVYLCSGEEDLAANAGQRSAVFRYNHSNDYVDLVLSIMSGYLTGGVATTPDPVVSARYAEPQPIAPIEDVDADGVWQPARGDGARGGEASGQVDGAGVKPPRDPAGTPAPGDGPEPGPDDVEQPTPDPTQDPEPEPTTVKIDETKYVQRPWTTVVDELVKLGVKATPVEQENSDRDPKLNGLVSSVSPGGDVKIGSTVTVGYFADASIVEGDYLDRLADEVVGELEALGWTVAHDEQPNDDPKLNDLVNGVVSEGSTVTVGYYAEAPPPSPTPDQTPSTDPAGSPESRPSDETPATQSD